MAGTNSSESGNWTGTDIIESLPINIDVKLNQLFLIDHRVIAP